MQNFSEVMKLLKKAEVKEGEDNFQSDLDLIFDALEFPEKYTKGEAENNEQFKSLNLIDLAKKAKPASQYMCLKYYKDFKKAAGDTAKSILISTAVRLQAFNIPEVMDLTCCDNLHLEELGDEKQVLYIIIPSSDDTFNFLAAMMYTQMFDVFTPNKQLTAEQRDRKRMRSVKKITTGIMAASMAASLMGITCFAANEGGGGSTEGVETFNTVVEFGKWTRVWT